MNKSLMDFIVRCADKYYEENLRFYESLKPTLTTDWWEAFDFFINQLCYQGRSDSMSEKVYKAAKGVLLPHFENEDRDLKYDAFKQQGWGGLRAELEKEIGSGKVGKGRDVKMVISALKFMGGLPNHNIVTYSIKEIQEGRLVDHYRELQAAKSANGITQVGPKVAAVYLQNLVSLFNLENFVDAESAFALVPVDTWVHQVAKKLEIADENTSKETIQHKLAEMCMENEIPAVRFNQGAYYIGVHAFDLLLDRASAF